MVAVSAGCECIGGTRGSGVVTSADDVLEMSVVRGVGGVCEMCMYLARSRVGGEWLGGLGLGITNPVGLRGVWDMCLWLGYGGVGGSGCVAWNRVWEGRVVLCLCVL